MIFLNIFRILYPGTRPGTTATGTARATRTRYTSTIIIYALLLLARFASVLLPGYVHPDEFYQGGHPGFCNDRFLYKQIGLAGFVLEGRLMA